MVLRSRAAAIISYGWHSAVVACSAYFDVACYLLGAMVIAQVSATVSRRKQTKKQHSEHLALPQLEGGLPLIREKGWRTLRTRRTQPTPTLTLALSLRRSDPINQRYSKRYSSCLVHSSVSTIFSKTKWYRPFAAQLSIPRIDSHRHPPVLTVSWPRCSEATFYGGK